MGLVNHAEDVIIRNLGTLAALLGVVVVDLFLVFG